MPEGGSSSDCAVQAATTQHELFITAQLASSALGDMTGELRNARLTKMIGDSFLVRGTETLIPKGIAGSTERVQV